MYTSPAIISLGKRGRELVAYFYCLLDDDVNDNIDGEVHDYVDGDDV